MSAAAAPEFVVRLCGTGDEEAVSLISQATILETYAGNAEGADLHAYVTTELTAEAWRKLLATDRARIWLAETSVGRCAVGYAAAISAEEGEPFSVTELKRLYVFYRFHRFGLGRKLMDEVMAHARASSTRRLTLRVAAHNENAIRFYGHYGFKIVSEEPFHAGERDYRVFVMQLVL